MIPLYLDIISAKWIPESSQTIRVPTIGRMGIRRSGKPYELCGNELFCITLGAPLDLDPSPGPSVDILIPIMFPLHR